jgi:hypothetical protein
LPEWYFWVVGEAPQDEVLILSIVILIVCLAMVKEPIILSVKVLHRLQQIDEYRNLSNAMYGKK